MTTNEVPPTAVLDRFFEAETRYMEGDEGASFAELAQTLDPDVVLHQSPDVPWGGEFHGHAGYEDWARQMRSAFDKLEMRDPRYLVDADTVVILGRLSTRSRATGEEMELPMAQVVRVRGDRIVEFRPFYWNVPAYRAALN